MLASIIAFLAQSIYRDFFESILKLAATEEYSYLAVSLTSILAVSYLSMKYSGLSRSIHLSRLLVSGLLVVLAVLVYLISRRVLEYCVYLQGLSFALLSISLATVIYDIKSPTYIAPLFTVLLATPLPAAFSDSVASILSRFVGRVIAYVTNSKLSELSMHTSIEVETPEGMRALTIETFSTGTDVLSTVASAIPAVLLSVSIGRASWSRKAAVSVASIAAALAIGFLGCVLRVLAVVYSAQRVGVEVAVESLHYVPSAIYSSASALLAFYLVFRYCDIGESVSKPLEVSRYTGISWRYVLGVLSVALVITSAAIVVTAVTEKTTTLGSVSGYVVEVKDLEEFLNNPAPYLSSENASLTSIERGGYVERVLGALRAYEIAIETSVGTYRGFLEIADTPARLRTWRPYLLHLGFDVTNSWSVNRGLTQLSYLVAEKQNHTYLLAYRLVPIDVRSEGGAHRLYARLSVLTEVVDQAVAIDSSTMVLLSIAKESTRDMGAGGNAVDALYVASYALLVLLAAYSAIAAVWSALYRRVYKLVSSVSTLMFKSIARSIRFGE